MVVVTGAGLVGAVADSTDTTATVETVLDPSSRVSGYTVNSGLEGTVMGDGTQLDIELQPQAGHTVSSGEWVLTSGLDGAFPRGLAIGEIVKLEKRDPTAVQGAHVTPAADVNSLTVVQVVLDFHP